MSIQGFILSTERVVLEGRQGLLLRGRLEDGRRFDWTVTQPRLVFFIERSANYTPSKAFRKSVELSTLRGEPLDALYFSFMGDLTRAREECEARSIFTYEADIGPAPRFLMERYIQGAVSFESEPTQGDEHRLVFTDPRVKPGDFTLKPRLLSLDIECSLGDDLYSIALYGENLARVYMLDPAGGGNAGEGEGGYIACASEKELLRACFADLRAFDPDVLIGWNVVGFDLRWLAKKCESLGMPFDIGTRGPARVIEPNTGSNQWLARIPGRSVLDGINMLRAAFVQLDDYSLGTAAHSILGRKKLIDKPGKERAYEITRQFNEDKPALAHYNLEDTRLVLEIFEKLSLAPLAVRRAQLTGLPLDRVGGSSAAFDFLYLPRLHRRGFAADTYARPTSDEAAPGGLVLDSAPGFYDNVAVLDFKSLYPSIIRTFKVDPLAASSMMYNLPGSDAAPAVRGPAGLAFAPDFAILPDIIQELWGARDQAKRDKDATLSYAVKIIMNSFYGVLGSAGCRFYEPRLAGTITRIGHWVLKYSRDYIEERGFRVIYGDTDSVFVHLGAGTETGVRSAGDELARELNVTLEGRLSEEFGVESRLDIEFEKFFLRFFMPTMRGRDTGARKRYAGILSEDDGLASAAAPDGAEGRLHFAGMESNRRDWTPLARDFQADIFRLVFRSRGGGVGDEQTENELTELIRDRHRRLHDGELDQVLEYRKGLSKPLDQYGASAPPHVKAARMLDEPSERVVRYVMTVEGPEPTLKRSAAAYDYEHYAEKQLAPIADMVLRFFNTDYQEVTGDGKQLGLFDAPA